MSDKTLSSGKMGEISNLCLNFKLYGNGAIHKFHFLLQVAGISNSLDLPLPNEKDNNSRKFAFPMMSLELYQIALKMSKNITS